MAKKETTWKDTMKHYEDLGSDPNTPVSEVMSTYKTDMKTNFSNAKKLNQARQERKENVAKRLNALREESGYKQKEVAEVIEINTMTLSGYEIGKSEPNFEVLVRLADFYKVSLDYVFCRTDTKIPFDPEEHEAQDRERQLALDRIQQLETELANIKNSLQ